MQEFLEMIAGSSSDGEHAEVCDWYDWEAFCEILIDVCNTEIAEMLGVEEYRAQRYYEACEGDLYQQIYNMTTIGTYTDQRCDIDEENSHGEIVTAGDGIIMQIISCVCTGLSVNTHQVFDHVIEKVSHGESEQVLSEKILYAREQYRKEQDLPLLEYHSREEGASLGTIN